MKQLYAATASSSKNQRGGTLLGIIFGALLGLGAALAVAVYVTKVPVPFLNKSPPHGAENDAAEAKKNRDWNPNTPLAGKNPARTSPVATGTVGEAPAVDTQAAVAVPAAVPAPGPLSSPAKAGGVKAQASSDPLGDLANARSAAKSDSKTASKNDTRTDVAKADPSSPTSGADPFSYFIQAGAFRTPEDAEQQRAKLSLIGFQARVTEREQAGRTVYRVRLGPFDKKDDADKAKEKLDGNAIETALVRVQR